MQELCHKDAQLEEQRRIIVEIQIRLDEKQKQLEALRQNLEVSQATSTRLEAEHSSLREQLRESEKKRTKASGVVQGLMAKTKLLSDELREAKERHSKAEWESRQQPPDEIGEMVNEETEVRPAPGAPVRNKASARQNYNIIRPLWPARRI